MQVFKAILVIFVNLIIYFGFGSLICSDRQKEKSLPITVTVGFFAYYALFAVVCLPIMLTYRPLSLLSRIWFFFVIVIFAISAVLNAKKWINSVKSIRSEFVLSKGIFLTVIILVIVQILLVACTYNFTLDAAYYVANVSTSVDTNMINVYDPFTGAWQDHFELRYVFATYSIHDAVICQLTGIPALVETKTVMASIVMIIVNLLYVWICRFLFGDNKKQKLIMYTSMIIVNLMFITLYTPANFLMTRTYEGKAIVGNIAVVAVFVMYMITVRYGMGIKEWLMLFVICLGTTTVSSTANMLIPAQLCVLFGPYILKNKQFKMIPRIIICMIPSVVMMMVYVLYVKGFFAIYTYPR